MHEEAQKSRGEAVWVKPDAVSFSDHMMKKNDDAAFFLNAQQMCKLR